MAMLRGFDPVWILATTLRVARLIFATAPSPSTFPDGPFRTLDETPVAWGQLPLTNPDTTLGNTYYGYNTGNGGPLTQDKHEAFKTEPDKNVYLVFGGHHYLYQGHEGGPAGYVSISSSWCLSSLSPVLGDWTRPAARMLRTPPQASL